MTKLFIQVEMAKFKISEYKKNIKKTMNMLRITISQKLKIKNKYINLEQS